MSHRGVNRLDCVSDARQPASVQSTASNNEQSTVPIGSITEKKLFWLLDAPSSAAKKIQTASEARDFIAFILASSDKLDTLSRLTSSDYGLKALQEALSIENTLKFIKRSVIPLICFIKNDDRLSIGSSRGASATKLLRTIFKTPDLFSELVEHVIDRKLTQDECSEIGWLVLQVIKGGDEFALEAKCDRNVLRLARALSMPGEYPKAKEVSDQINTLLDVVHHDTASSVTNVDNFDNFDECEATPVSDTDKTDARHHPGWRHSNDKADFHSISIYPTADELQCQEGPFLPETFEPRTVSSYLDWAFRLLREDINQVVKEELDAILPRLGFESNNNPRLSSRLRNRTLSVIRFSDISCNHKFGVGFKMQFKEPQSLLNLLEQIPAQHGDLEKSKQDYWEERTNFLKTQSILVFIRNSSEFIGLGVVNVRELMELVQEPPSIDVYFFDKSDLKRVVVELGVDQPDLKAVQLSVSFFAYTPILERLKMLSCLPFENELLHNGEVRLPNLFNDKLEMLVQQLENVDSSIDLAPILGLSAPLILDGSQKKAVTCSLRRRVALIQGPPGTGKSYCGAVISKIIFDNTAETILCVTYTNHALDQFLEDLIDFGLPTSQIVRIGGPEKISERIRPFTMFAFLKATQGGRDSNRMFRNLRDRMDQLCNEINHFKEWIAYLNTTVEMKDFAPVFTDQLCDAFLVVPVENSEIEPDYLWKNWIKGHQRPGSVWSMPQSDRVRKITEWRQQLIAPYLEQLNKAIIRYNELSEELNEMYQIAEIRLLKSKRIIGCTTTGAAKYATKLDAVSAGVLIMEEAGEILEAHVVTSMASNCKHLIMIGDHKQLRPKLNNYNLTVESNGPFKFNRSLFERLATSDFPHVTLQLQHRMRPEISDLVRQLTYPELQDADKVKNRQNLRGLPSNIIFIQHEHLEGNDDELFPGKSGDDVDSLSKINHYEVAMVAKIVEYLLNHHQGYQGSQIVVLTPYLAQLHAIRNEMSKICQVVLSELDQADLNRLGIDTVFSKRTQTISRNNKNNQPPIIRVSTVDNYQGEESDIVIASLVRSNPEGNIGFVGQPERVNVLLSRARDGLILLGNRTTFEKCRSLKGRELWMKLLKIFSEKHAIYPGFPARCDVHDRTFYLNNPANFDKIIGDKISCEPGYSRCSFE